MKRLLFVTGARFREIDGVFYCSGPFNALLWERFLQYVDEIAVVGRHASAHDVIGKSHSNTSSHDKVAFHLLPDLASLTGQVLHTLKVRRSLEKLVAGADAVVARLPSLNGIMAVHIATGYGSKLCVLVAGCCWDGLWNYGGVKGKMYAPVMYWRTRQAVRKAPAILYVTRRFLQSRYPAGRQARAVGISDVIIPVLDEAVLRQRLHRARETENHFVLGTIGSLGSKIKGFHVAMQAIGKLLDSRPGYTLEYRILGSGDPKPWKQAAVKAGIGNIVHFDGTVPSGHQVFQWLDALDVYLHPSFKEGLPRAVVEAMSRGCPVIASSAGGTPEVLPSSVLHSPGDVDGLTKLLDHVLSDAQWRIDNAARNFERARDFEKPLLDGQTDLFLSEFFADEKTGQRQ